MVWPNTEPLARVGLISDANNCPRVHAEEPSRSLFDLLKRNAVREHAVGVGANARSHDAAAGLCHSPRVRERLGHASAIRDICNHTGPRKEPMNWIPNYRQLVSPYLSIIFLTLLRRPQFAMLLPILVCIIRSEND
jgi:hypothetical protein